MSPLSEWQCIRCKSDNTGEALFCVTCGEPKTVDARETNRAESWWRKKGFWLVAVIGWMLALGNCVALLAVLASDQNGSLLDTDSLAIESIRTSSDCDELLVWFTGGYLENRIDITIEAIDRFATLSCDDGLMNRSGLLTLSTPVIPAATTSTHRESADLVVNRFKAYAQTKPAGEFSFFTCWDVAIGADNVFSTEFHIYAEHDKRPGFWIVTVTAESMFDAPKVQMWTYRESNNLFVGPC